MTIARGNLSIEYNVGTDDASSDDELLGDDGFDIVEDVTIARRCDPIIVPAYSIPVVNAGLGSVKVALGLVEKHSNYPFIISLSGVNFLVMLGMNLRYTMAGIKGTVSYLRTRTTPSDWVAISDGKNKLALALALSTAITKASTDAVLNRYFVSRLPIKFHFTDTINQPGWEFFGWTMSGFTFVGSLASGGMAMYAKLRNTVFGGAPTEYSCKVSRYVSPALGTTLSLTYAVSSLSSTITSVSHTFGITSAPGIAGVCTLGVVNAVNAQFTNIPFNVNALDKFCGSFTAREGQTPAYKDPYTIVSFSAAMAAGGLIAYSSRALTKVLLDHSLEILGVNCTSVTDPIVTSIADTTIFSNLLWVGGALTPLFYDAATSFVSALSNCCQRAKPEGDMKEVEPLLVSDTEIDIASLPDNEATTTREGTMHRMFQPKKEEVAPDPQDYSSQRSCGIM